MPKSKPQVFLDANILISAGKPPGGPEIARVIDLVDAGLVTILTTDLTVIEVAKKHASNDLEVVAPVAQAHFRKLVAGLTGLQLPDLKKTDLRAKLAETYQAASEAMFKVLEAKTLKIDDVRPSQVFDAYAAGEGFFAEGKKDQFPDAFAFECLKQQASAATPVIIVSQDNDFAAPVKGQAHISLVGSLPALFAELGLEMEAPEISQFLDAHKKELLAAVDEELVDWGLQGDVEDSVIDSTSVTDVEVYQVTAFRPIEKGDPILVVARIGAMVDLTYSHPDWDNAAYDSEDKVLIPFDDVSGETTVDLEIDVSMSIAVDDDGNPDEIARLGFRNDAFVYVALQPDDGYPYK